MQAEKARPIAEVSHGCEKKPVEVHSNYKEVRGLVRGLRVLVALNANARTQVSISKISQATKLHRTTVKRLLETLRHEGYVDYDDVSATYSLRLAVKQLSCGYVDDERMAEVARHTMHSLSKRSIWPISLVTFDIDAMLIRETTAFRAPIVADKTMPGMRIPILFTAAGRAFLFACTEDRRHQIVALLAKKHDEEGFFARDTRRLSEIKRQTEHFRCGINVRSWTGHSDRSAIAVPILHEDIAIGALNMLFHVNAIPIEDAIKENLSMLQDAAAAIAAAMRDGS
jgi:IclR family transcriptional regulator, mhp operon transcriptional activator